MPADAGALGAVRAGVFGFVLCEVLLTSFDNLGRLPTTVLRPTGAMRLLPWGFYERLLTPGAMTAFKWVFAASLLAAAAGLFTNYTTKTAALFFLFHQGLLRSFTHFNHDEMPAVFVLFVLAFTPCGDAFSLDSLRGRVGAWRAKDSDGALVYGYPVLLMRLLLAWSYFSSALIKLRVAGPGYLSPDNLPALAVTNSLDNLHDTHFRAAFWLVGHREWTPYFVALALAWELAFPLAVFSRRARVPILAAGVLFHLATLVLMNIFFPYHLALYLVFFDWPALARRLRARVLASRGAASSGGGPASRPEDSF
ncbi:MAG TPA: HTTM domain-containing protein [Pyrinomonadaceae bacterium]